MTDRDDAGDFAPVALAPPEVLLRAVSDGLRLGLQLAYVDGAGASLKRAGGAWMAPRRMWVTEAAPAVRTLAWLRAAMAGQPFDQGNSPTSTVLVPAAAGRQHRLKECIPA